MNLSRNILCACGRVIHESGHDVGYTVYDDQGDIVEFLCRSCGEKENQLRMLERGEPIVVDSPM